MNNQRSAWVDIVRGLGIILVIIGHCHRPDLLLKIIQSFHMPLFFFLSGYLFSLKDESFFQNTKRMLKRYIKPYVILGVFNYILWMFIKWLQHNSPEKLIALAKRYAIGLICSRGTWYWMPNCSPIWFLTTIFIACLLFRIIIKQKQVVQFVLILACISLTYYFCNYATIKLFWNIDSAIWAQPYMYIGFQIKKGLFDKFTSSKVKTVVTCTALLAIGLFAAIKNPIDFLSMYTMTSGNILLAFLSSIFISLALIFFVKTFIKKNYVLELFGRNTIIILGFNYIVNFLVYRIWNMMFGDNEFSFYWLWQCLIQIIILGLIAYLYEYKKGQKSELY